ncbi:MAG: DUF2726 domain-containing protein [Mediterranea sp.]|nr:DUF2726 domain-containing protein [Mediterranea sp.]
MFNNNYERDYKGNELKVARSCLEDTHSNKIFEYFKAIASVNPLKADDGTALLEGQYARIDFIDEQRAVTPYLNPQLYKRGQYGSLPLIYPFGCNASQKAAVRKAFESQLSVIQGPPGTGKTQTILNIVANIIVSKKTVLVVSNNNSAVANILEKMYKHDMGFIVAQLGSKENKEAFIASQATDKRYPDNLNTWHDTDADKRQYSQSIEEKAKALDDIFAKQERLAIAKQESRMIELEWEHFEREVENAVPDMALRWPLRSKQIMKLWQDIQNHEEQNSQGLIASIKRSVQEIFLKTKLLLLLKGVGNGFYSKKISNHIPFLQRSYYQTKRAELKREVEQIERTLQSLNADKLGKELTELSMVYLKNQIYHKYGHKQEKPIFTVEVFRQKSAEVSDEYPVILSTTFSSRNCLDPKHGFDYVIMDEASQVSAETGFLALSCANNAVIVGDSRQLPNVITSEDKLLYQSIALKFGVEEMYDCANHSFLASVCEAIPDIPQTLLKEHYRCHPKIINFCNQRFYGGNLVIMTEDLNEEDVLTAIKTVKGNHSRDHANQREVDVVAAEVLPGLPYPSDEIGIITPYNHQVAAFKRHLGEGVDVATVHKFQGREKNAIVMSVVDDQISPFADDPNLLNVAISRAKAKFCLVVSGNEQAREGNISDLIAYIEYHNFTVSKSKVRSIYDYLYKQYTDARMEYLNQHESISRYDSENLTFALLKDILKENVEQNYLDILFQYPLNRLLPDYTLLDEEERKYAMHNATHIDFLIYNRASKHPILAIETDGYEYHKANTAQHRRDLLKNHILELYGIPLIRLSTTGSGERRRIEDKLGEILKRDC